MEDLPKLLSTASILILISPCLPSYLLLLLHCLCFFLRPILPSPSISNTCLSPHQLLWMNWLDQSHFLPTHYLITCPGIYQNFFVFSGVFQHYQQHIYKFISFYTTNRYSNFNILIHYYFCLPLYCFVLFNRIPQKKVVYSLCPCLSSGSFLNSLCFCHSTKSVLRFTRELEMAKVSGQFPVFHFDVSVAVDTIDQAL